MHLDANKLIVQSNADAGDTLANQSTWAVACALNPKAIATPTPRMWALHNSPKAYEFSGAQALFEVRPGIYVRNPTTSKDSISEQFYWWNFPETVTRDQLLGVLLANTLHGMDYENVRLVRQIIHRKGFAQNIYRTGADGITQGKKTPDTFLGHFQFFIRPFPILRWVFYPVLLVTDLIALFVKTPFIVIPYRMKDGGKIVKRTYDDVDVRNKTLAFIMSMQAPTPFSWLSRQLFSTFMHKNYGMLPQWRWPAVEEMHAKKPLTENEFASFQIVQLAGEGESNRVMGAWLWYFRPSAGGNIEIAQAMAPIIKKYFRGFKWLQN